MAQSLYIGMNMTNGLFKLWVRDDEKTWGLLSTMEFDDSYRRKIHHRVHTLRRMEKSMYGWRCNFWKYRHADFALEEQASPYDLPRHVLGTHREHGKLRSGLKRKPRIKRKQKVKRKGKSK